MGSIIEIGKDRQSLLWRRHLLTAAMEHLHLSDLMLEPVMNPAGRPVLKLECDDLSLRWTWGKWNRVEIRGYDSQQATAALTFTRSQRTEVRWSELPAAREAELTFSNADGDVARAKVEVPDLANFGRDVEILPVDGRVRIRLLKPRAGLVSVEFLRLGMDGEYKLSGKPFLFSAGSLQASVPMPGNFFGILAVVNARNNRRTLIGSSEFKYRLGQPLSPADQELHKLRRFVERTVKSGSRAEEHLTPEEWFANWPAYSQQQLRALYEKSTAHLRWITVGNGVDLIRTNPTGLLRYLVLANCGYESPNPGQLVKQLSQNTFLEALKAVLPKLANALSKLVDPSEQIWAIKHANSPSFEEAVTSAGNHGVAALERAQHLQDKRSEAIKSWTQRKNQFTANSMNASASGVTSNTGAGK